MMGVTVMWWTDDDDDDKKQWHKLGGGGGGEWGMGVKKETKWNKTVVMMNPIVMVIVILLEIVW